MTNTVTIGVASREEIDARFKRAMTTGRRTAPFIGFADERALWSTLTPLRWAILNAMTGAEPLALPEIARRVGRDVRGVHTSVHALLAVGLIERDEAGLRFPYDAVHVDFVPRAAWFSGTRMLHAEMENPILRRLTAKSRHC